MSDPIFVSITARIEQRGPRGGRSNEITIEEEAELSNLTFMELAQIMQQFHDLVAEFKAKRKTGSNVAGAPASANLNPRPAMHS